MTAGLAPQVEAEQPHRRVRLSTPPTAREAACWVGVCDILGDHEPRCPRTPDASQRAAALLRRTLHQRRETR